MNDKDTQKKLNNYFEKEGLWKKELMTLRKILLEFPVQETFKWNAPTYVYQDKNVVGLAGFKNYFGIWFFQGVFIKDTYNVFINAQEGKTKAMRQWRFTNANQIEADKIKVYLKQALHNVELGMEIKPKKNTTKVELPGLLANEISLNPKLKNQFNSLSNGQQRLYTEYMDEAKKEVTKVKRLQKIIPMILAGKGLYDKYK